MWSYRRSIGKPQRVSVQTDVWAVVAELALVEESWHEVEEVEAVLYTMESGIVLSSPAAFVWKLLRQLERMKFCEVRRNAAPALHHMLASRLRWSEFPGLRSKSASVASRSQTLQLCLDGCA